MSNFNSNLTQWASTGEEYPTNYKYEQGESPVDEWDNYAMYHIIKEIGELLDYAQNAHEDINNLQSNKADISHGNAQHSKTFAVDGDEQPAEVHGNARHSQTFAVDGDEQPAQSHGNERHTETFAVDGAEQPPENHNNSSHSDDFLLSTTEGVINVQVNGNDGTDSSNRPILNIKTQL